MNLTQEHQATIRGAARWAVALAVVLALSIVRNLGHLTDGSLRDGLLWLALLVVSGWQMLALALSAFAFCGRPTAERFESGLYGLRTFAKVGVLALPIVAAAAGVTCELSTSTHVETSEDADR